MNTPGLSQWMCCPTADCTAYMLLLRTVQNSYIYFNNCRGRCFKPALEIVKILVLQYSKEWAYLDFKLWRFCLNFSFMGITSLAWMLARAGEKGGYDSWWLCDEMCLKCLQIICRGELNCACPRRWPAVSQVCVPHSLTDSSSSQLLFLWGWLNVW